MVARVCSGLPMKPFFRVLALLLALPSLLATSRASADDDGAPIDVAPVAPVDVAPVATTPNERESAIQLHLDAAAGVSSSGALVSALGLARFGHLEVGGSFGSSGLFGSRTGGGLAAGAGGHRPGGGGWDVLLELGMNQQHVAGNLLSSDPGASGTIAYGGLRAGIDWSFGNASAVAHPTLGLWLFARTDLQQRTSSYAYQETGWFSGRSDSRSSSVTLGGGGELGIAIAGGLDLLP
jgi:hypothetical protein